MFKNNCSGEVLVLFIRNCFAFVSGEKGMGIISRITDMFSLLYQILTALPKCESFHLHTSHALISGSSHKQTWCS